MHPRRLCRPSWLTLISPFWTAKVFLAPAPTLRPVPTVGVTFLCMGHRISGVGAAASARYAAERHRRATTRRRFCHRLRRADRGLEVFFLYPHFWSTITLSWTCERMRPKTSTAASGSGSLNWRIGPEVLSSICLAIHVREFWPENDREAAKATGRRAGLSEPAFDELL